MVPQSEGRLLALLADARLATGANSTAYFPSTSVTKKKKGFYNVAYHLWLLLRLFRCTSKLKIAPTKNFERLQTN